MSTWGSLQPWGVCVCVSAAVSYGEVCKQQYLAERTSQTSLSLCARCLTDIHPGSLSEENNGSLSPSLV